MIFWKCFYSQVMNSKDWRSAFARWKWDFWCVCVCFCHLVVCGQASVEEDLLSVALTPLQMSHSFLPFYLWEGENDRSVKSALSTLKWRKKLNFSQRQKNYQYSLFCSTKKPFFFKINLIKTCWLYITSKRSASLFYKCEGSRFLTFTFTDECCKGLMSYMTFPHGHWAKVLCAL